MPLEQGGSKRAVARNIRELVTTPPSSVRRKGIESIARRRHTTYERAKQIQAEAIALSTAHRFNRKG